MTKEERLRLARNEAGQVHPIQARKAAEDRETWRSAQVLDVRGRLIEVRFDGGEDATFMSGRAHLVALDRVRRALITERWGVMSFRSDDIASPATGYGGEPPSSVFDRAGSSRLRMIGVRRVPDEYVYGTVTGIDDEQYFYLVPRAEAEEVSDIMEIMTTCRTWGDLRGRASPARFEEILDLAGYNDFDAFAAHLTVGRSIPGVYEEAAQAWKQRRQAGIPADDERFDPYEIDSFHSADWPPALEYLQHQYLPAEVVGPHGRRYETTINGSYVEIPVDEGPAAIAVLERLGIVCVEETELLQGIKSAWGLL